MHLKEETLLQWKEAPPDTLMDSKLKCVFEMPNDVLPVMNSFVITDKEDSKKRDTYAVSISFFSMYLFYMYHFFKMTNLSYLLERLFLNSIGIFTASRQRRYWNSEGQRRNSSFKRRTELNSERKSTTKGIQLGFYKSFINFCRSFFWQGFKHRWRIISSFLDITW